MGKNKLKVLEGSQESVFSTPDTGKKKKKKGKGETRAKVAEVSVLSSKVNDEELPRRLLAEECVGMTTPSKKKKKNNKDHGTPLNSQEEETDQVNLLKKKNKNHESPSTSQGEVNNPVNSPKKKKNKRKEREGRENFLGQLNLSPRRDSDHTDSPSNNNKKHMEEVQNEVFSPSHKRPSDTDTPTHKSKKHKTQDEPSTPQARVRHNSLGTPQQNKATSDKSSRRETSPPPSQETPKSKKKKGLDSHSDSQGTPQREKKKKRNTSSDAPPMNIEEDVKIEEMVPPWTRESVLSLVHQMREQLPRKDNKRYRITLNKFDWRKIVVGDYSAEMIKEQFNHIMTKMTVIKPLTQLVNEIEVVARKKFEVFQTRSALPLTRFLIEYLTPERKADLQKRKVNMLKAVSAEWNKLSNHEKQVYIDQFKEGHTHTKNRHTLPQKEKRPYVIWAKHVGHTGKAQRAFNNLPVEEKITYIELALQRIARVEQDKREPGEPDDRDDEDEQHNNAKKRVLPLVSRDDLELFLNSKEMPALPPKIPLRLYYDNMKDAGDLDHMDPMKKWLHASSLFSQLPQEDKGKYKAKHDKILARYLKEYKVWADQQDEVTLLAKRMYTDEKTKKSSEDNPKTKAKSVRDLFPNTCRNYMSCPKFKNELTRPPRTPLLHYIKRTSNKLPNDTSKTEKHKISAARWKELDDDDKELFNTEWKESLKNYESKLLAFVGEMDKKTRTLYLGFHRVTLFTLFKRDIFTDYPNSKYPVNEESFPKLREPSTNSASNEPEYMLDLIESNSRSRQKLKPSQSKEYVSTDEGDGDASDSDEQTQHRKKKIKKVKAHPQESKSEEEKGSATSSSSPQTKSPSKSQRHEMNESSEEEHISLGQIQSRNSPTKRQEADESDKSSEDEEVIPAKHLTKRSPVKQQTTNYDSSENEIPATQSQIKKSPVLPKNPQIKKSPILPKKTQIKKSPILPKKLPVQTSSEEEPNSSDDDDLPNVSPPKPSVTAKPTKPAEDKDSGNDDDDDDDSDFDAVPAWRTNSQINRSQKQDTSSSDSD